MMIFLIASIEKVDSSSTSHVAIGVTKFAPACNTNPALPYRQLCYSKSIAQVEHQHCRTFAKGTKQLLLSWYQVGI